MVKPKEPDRIIAEKKERLKELACINRTTQKRISIITCNNNVPLN